MDWKEELQNAIQLIESTTRYYDYLGVNVRTRGGGQFPIITLLDREGTGLLELTVEVYLDVGNGIIGGIEVTNGASAPTVIELHGSNAGPFYWTNEKKEKRDIKVIIEDLLLYAKAADRLRYQSVQ